MMPRVCLSLFAAVLLAGSLHAAPANWLTDYGAALKQAAAEGKPLLIEFTGSSWCPPCKLMDKTVFTQEEFASFAEKNLILLKIDLPPYDPPQPDSVADRNQALFEQYRCEGVPTMIILNPKGKELERAVGVVPGGLNGFLKWVEGVIKH